VLLSLPFMSSEPEPDPVPELMRLFETGRPSDRRHAAREFGRLGPAAGAGIPLIVPSLMDTDGELRAVVSDALAKIGEPAVKPLIESLLNPDLDHRRAVIITLGKMGPGAMSAVPVLTSALEDPQLGQWAAQAIDHIQADTIPSIASRFRRTFMLALLLSGLFTGLLIVILLGAWASHTMSSQATGLIAKLGTAIAILAGGIGTIMCGSRWGRGGAVLGGLFCTLAGGAVGMCLGALANMVVGPIVEAMGGKH
jgi:HEAT repeat protein